MLACAEWINLWQSSTAPQPKATTFGLACLRVPIRNEMIYLGAEKEVSQFGHECVYVHIRAMP